MVLRCFSCETFQVHQVRLEGDGREGAGVAVNSSALSFLQVKKSSNKWVCKICNEKQSVQKVILAHSAPQTLHRHCSRHSGVSYKHSY